MGPGLMRRPTVGPNPHPSSPGYGESSRRCSNPYAPDDDGLVMREKGESGSGSIGKAGGVGVGVTRPKRRLSR